MEKDSSTRFSLESQGLFFSLLCTKEQLSLNKHPEPPSGARIQRSPNTVFLPGCHSNGDREYHRHRKGAGCCCCLLETSKWEWPEDQNWGFFCWGLRFSEQGLLPWASLFREKPRTASTLSGSSCSWYQKNRWEAACWKLCKAARISNPPFHLNIPRHWTWSDNSVET